jgi:hypothetical protein
MAYATTAELQTRLGNGYNPTNAQTLLDRASRDIDQALLSAIYSPTEAAIIAALKDACLEQVVYQLEIGNTSGIRHGMQPGVPSGSSAGTVDLSRGQSAGGSSVGQPRLGEQVWSILQKAGLTGMAPYTYLT